MENVDFGNVVFFIRIIVCYVIIYYYVGCVYMVFGCWFDVIKIFVFVFIFFICMK